MSRKPNRWRKVIKVSAILMVVLLAVMAICYRIFGISDAAATYNKNLLAARDAGLWFDGDRIASRLNVPDQDNGLPMLRDLLKTLNDKQKSSSTKTNQELFEIRWKIVEPSLPLIRQAIAKPFLLPKFDPKAPYDGYKEFNLLLPVFKTLVKGVDVYVNQSRFPEAQKLLLNSAAFAAHFRQDLMRSHAAIGAADDVECKIRDLIPRFGHDPKWLAILSKALVLLDSPWDLHDHVKFSHWESLWSAERVLGYSKDGTLEDLGLKADDSKPVEYTMGKLLPLFAKANLSRLHEYYVDILNRLPKNPNDFTSAAKVLRTAPDEGYPNLSYRVLDQLSEGSYRFAVNYEIECAQRNVLRQALAVLQADADLSKGFPLKGLAALDRRGKPLGLEHTKRGWIIYSVGQNGKDDHALPAPAYVDDFIVHFSTATIDPKDSTRQPRWGLDAGGIQ